MLIIVICYELFLFLILFLLHKKNYKNFIDSIENKEFIISFCFFSMIGSFFIMVKYNDYIKATIEEKTCFVINKNNFKYIDLSLKSNFDLGNMGFRSEKEINYLIKKNIKNYESSFDKKIEQYKIYNAGENDFFEKKYIEALNITQEFKRRKEFCSTNYCSSDYFYALDIENQELLMKRYIFFLEKHICK